MRSGRIKLSSVVVSSEDEDVPADKRPASRNSSVGGSTISDSKGPSPKALASVMEDALVLNNGEMGNGMTFEKVQCASCFTDLNPDEGIMLRSCLHNFCMDCTKSLIQQSDLPQIVCPSVIEKGGKVKSSVEDDDIFLSANEKSGKEVKVKPTVEAGDMDLFATDEEVEDIDFEKSGKTVSARAKPIIKVDLSATEKAGKAVKVKPKIEVEDIYLSATEEVDDIDLSATKKAEKAVSGKAKPSIEVDDIDLPATKKSGKAVKGKVKCKIEVEDIDLSATEEADEIDLPATGKGGKTKPSIEVDGIDLPAIKKSGTAVRSKVKPKIEVEDIDLSATEEVDDIDFPATEQGGKAVSGKAKPSIEVDGIDLPATEKSGKAVRSKVKPTIEADDIDLPATENVAKTKSKIEVEDMDLTITLDDMDIDDLLSPLDDARPAVIDNEQPSTSKKAAADLAKSQRRTKRTSGDSKKSKLSKEVAETKRGVLGSSDEEEDDFKDSSSHKKKSKRESKSKQPSDYDWKKDRKLEEDASKVVLEPLSVEIEKELKKNAFITIKKPSKDDTSDQEDSDSSIRRLERAIKRLTHLKPAAHGKSKCTPLRKGKEQKSGSRGKKGSDDDDELLDPSSGDEAHPTKEKVDIAGISGYMEHNDGDIGADHSSASDMEATNEGQDDFKKKSSRDKKQEKNKSKKYVTPKVTLSDSDDSESENKKKLLAKDSDEDSDVEEKITKRSKKIEDEAADSDDSIITKRVVRNTRKKKQLLSDSEDSGKPSKGSDSDILSVHSSNDDDSDFGKKKKKSKRKKAASDSSSDEDRKKKKKRRKRIKEERDSDDSDASKAKSDDSDVQEVEVIPASQKRKKIRDIMGNKDLRKSTREAEKEEEERKKRVLEKQKLFNGMLEASAAETSVGDAGSVKRLILDMDPETKEPAIEVDGTIVSKLKPHQVDGIKFMYTTCFESIEMIKKKKEGGCILAHCMGLGKTLQTVAFTHTMLANKEITEVKTALVVCPLNTVNNWEKEYKQWTQDADVHINVFCLWDGKNLKERMSALRTWQRRGGVGIIHYDLFRNLANMAMGKGRGKKAKAADRELITSNLLNPGPDMVICDEGHLLKNCKSKLTEALSQIRTTRRVVLSGTPLQNNLVEYHTMVNFVKPNLLGSLKEFTNRFVNPIKNGQCKDSSERDVRVMKRRAHVLHSKLDGCVQRLDYSVLTPYLPPKYEYCIIIKLSEKQKELYRLYLNSQVSEDSTERARRILSHYAVLIKILAHPVVLTMKKAMVNSDLETDEEGSLKDFIDDGGDMSDCETSVSGSGSDTEVTKKKNVPKRKTRSCKDEDVIDPEEETSNASAAGASKPNVGTEWWSGVFQKKEEMYDVELSGKLVVLQEILKICETIGDRVLVFSQYLTTLNIIEEFLEEWDKEAREKNGDVPRTFPPLPENPTGRWRSGLEYFRIDGATKSTDRQKHCDVFNKKSSSKAKLFLISTRAGGLGINLFGANRVVIFDASWNPSNDMQSIFRVFRFGQQKPCYIYRFVAQATMEEKIYNRQVVKLSLSSRVVDEHQVERHFKFDDITEMYKYNPDEKSERPTPPVPKDRLLADLLISHKDWIDSYFEHDTLLVNKQDEELTEEERKAAWEEYRTENDRRPVPSNLSMADLVTLQKIKARLLERFPEAPDLRIQATAEMVLGKINNLRMMLHQFNMTQATLSPEQKAETEKHIKDLQDWIAIALNGTAGGGAQVQQSSGVNSASQYRNNTTYSRSRPPPPAMLRMPSRLQSMDPVARQQMQANFMQSLSRVIPNAHTVNGQVNHQQQQWIPSYAQRLPYAPNGPTNLNNVGGTPDSPLTLD